MASNLIRIGEPSVIYLSSRNYWYEFIFQHANGLLERRTLNAQYFHQLWAPIKIPNYIPHIPIRLWITPCGVRKAELWIWRPHYSSAYRIGLRRYDILDDNDTFICGAICAPVFELVFGYRLKYRYKFIQAPVTIEMELL